MKLIASPLHEGGEEKAFAKMSVTPRQPEAHKKLDGGQSMTHTLSAVLFYDLKVQQNMRIN